MPRPLVYRALDHLESVGLVTPSSTEPGEKGAVRTLFRTTEHGRELVARWLDEPISHPRDVRTHLMVKFVLLARRGRTGRELASVQLAAFRAAADGLEDKALAARGDERFLALWRVESMRAITRYLEQLTGCEADISATDPPPRAASGDDPPPSGDAS